LKRIGRDKEGDKKQAEGHREEWKKGRTKNQLLFL